ncbi:MAG: very short patch repair endonuclease [Planctomycetes bacterium]|nr:very short patch repair endonuclease [Planctomycetota bacterium]
MAARKKAGHRKWAPRGGKVPGVHRGDVMSPEKRSRLMAKIKGKDTSPELAIEKQLRIRGLEFERHCPDLPGKPDFVFRDERVAVFVDGDFWHGYRFSLWEHKLSQKWRKKIAATRSRDTRNFAKLRRLGWKVVRIWEHQVERNPSKCADRVDEAVRSHSP